MCIRDRCCTPLIEKIWNALRKHTVTRVAAVLVLGVGNRRVTADALGPRTVQKAVSYTHLP